MLMSAFNQAVLCESRMYPKCFTRSCKTNAMCCIGAQCTWECSNLVTFSPISLTCSQSLVRVVLSFLCTDLL